MMVSKEVLNLQEICERYEEMELTTDSNDVTSKSNIYLNLLAIYLLESNLIQAKFLWKRIPDNVKLSCPDLEYLWKVGQLLWKRDFPEVYQALEREWPSCIQQYITSLKGKLQDRLITLISKAYSNIKLEDFCQQVGMNKDEAITVALKNNWEVDQNTDFIHPKLQDHPKVDEPWIPSEEQLAHLTDYISYLEN